MENSYYKCDIPILGYGMDEILRKFRMEQSISEILLRFSSNFTEVESPSVVIRHFLCTRYDFYKFCENCQ